MPEEKKPARTKDCPKCGTSIDVNRGVCPSCGYMFPWFQIRFYVGGCSALLALVGLLLMALMNMFGPTPPAQ